MYISMCSQPMYWLPEELPRNVHVIVSTQTGDDKSLDELLGNRHCAQLEVGSLGSQTIQMLSKVTFDLVHE